MDREMRREFRDILDEIKMETIRAQRELLEEAGEKYISAAELCNQFQCFSRDWVSRNGKLLPRVNVVVRDKDGNESATRYAYPQHRIARMLKEGKLDFLVES